MMDKDLIPVAPAAHYMCGGVATNIDGETSIKGLYAFGEVARTGVHGANRLASNSLLECLVFSSRALKSASNYIKRTTNNLPARASQWQAGEQRTTNKKINKKDNLQILKFKKQIQKLMWENIGIIREPAKMRITLQKLNNIAKKIQKIYNKGVNKNIIEVNNICTVAILITKAAIQRKKSIGCHFIKNQ
jgi:L-aspartate oxidase